MRNKNKIEKISTDSAEKIINRLVFCKYCNEPFKECDTVIPSIGVILGKIDVVKWRNNFWHSGCIQDYQKQKDFKP